MKSRSQIATEVTCRTLSLDILSIWDYILLNMFPAAAAAVAAVGEMALALWEYQVGAGSREPK